MHRYFFLFLLLWACQTPSENAYLIEAPAGERYCSINKSAQSILPNGRIIEPYGQTIDMAPHPFGLELSQDGVDFTKKADFRALLSALCSG